MTPVEKVGITVDDAPFLAVEMPKERGENGACPAPSGPMSEDWVRPARIIPCASNRVEYRRAEALCACARAISGRW